MKKKIMAAALCMLTLTVFTACGKKDTSDLVYMKDFDPEKFVTLGDYQNVEIALDEPSVSEEYLEGYVEYLLQNDPVYVPVTGRAAQMGDTANIDFEGKLDGVAFEGGTAKGTELTLGSGRFIEGFEDGVVGMEIGETKDLNLTFPDPYDNNPDLAGKEVVFTVTLNGLSTKETPELTDDYVKSLEMEGLTNVEEYRQYVYDILMEQQQSNYDSDKQNLAVEELVKACGFEEVPEGMLNRMSDTLTKSITSYAQMYGMEIGDYVASAYGGTAEDHEATLREQARLMAQRYLMLAAVASREGLTVSDEELNAQLESDASSYGYDGVDSYVEQSGLDKEAYREYMLIQKAMEYLTEHVKVVAQTQE